MWFFLLVYQGHKGLVLRFLAFQYPVEIPGVNNEDFLRLAYNSKQKALNKSELDPIQFLEVISDKLKIVNLNCLIIISIFNTSLCYAFKQSVYIARLGQ